MIYRSGTAEPQLPDPEQHQQYEARCSVPDTNYPVASHASFNDESARTYSCLTANNLPPKNTFKYVEYSIFKRLQKRPEGNGHLNDEAQRNNIRGNPQRHGRPDSPGRYRRRRRH
jgi:hypothetical protein